MYAPAISARENLDPLLQEVKQSPFVRHWLLYSVAFAGALWIACADPLTRWLGSTHANAYTAIIDDQTYNNGVLFWRTLGGFFLGSALLERVLGCFDRSLIKPDEK
jgi:hypothetical protein